MIWLRHPLIPLEEGQEQSVEAATRTVRTAWPASAMAAVMLACALPAGSAATYAPLRTALAHRDADFPDTAVTAGPHLPLLPGLPGGPDTETDPMAGIDADTARALNAAAAFVPLGSDQPTSVKFTDKNADFARALDCLASAVLYEAGDDPVGQAAVAQVVINRMHHPAFPHSVCAVVYQGSERATGCQFTFTCDRALQRLPPPAAWQRARKLAESFLEGRIEPSVGLATHYHTDWVHPYWSDSLDKIARVGTHLFFRWRGSWGQRSAFSTGRAWPEPSEPGLALLSEAHRNAAPAGGSAIASIAAATAVPDRALSGDRVVAGPNDHFIQTEGSGNGSDLAMQALGLCRAETTCKVVGWDRQAQAYGSPADPLVRSVAFLYVRDARTGVEVVLWDCARYNRPLDTQCLSAANRRWITFTGSLTRTAGSELPQRPIALHETAAKAPHMAGTHPDATAGI